MSETYIFIVGVIIFTVTVYGAVAAGGTAFKNMEVEQNPGNKDVDDADGLNPFTTE